MRRERTYQILRTNSVRLLLVLLLIFAGQHAWSQIVIGGKVFGGARQADVGGSTFVNVGADNHDVIITAVYGGNDISGTVGRGTTVPTQLDQTLVEANGINSTYNAFISTNAESNGKHLFIGKVYGGGNGDYYYPETTEEGKYVAKSLKDMTTVVATSEAPFVLPVLDQTYLELKGGTIAHVYGGGDAVTVKTKTDICINNTSDVSKPENMPLLNDDLLTKMDVNSTQTNLEGDYQFARVFGGNNKAPMSIRPTWHLLKGKIRDLYSGGNKGTMTHTNGIALILTSPNMEIDNVYAGCRMADVNPGGNYQANPIAAETIGGVDFPEGYAARVSIRGGNINNVYGGNDITGTVFGGSAVGIHSSINKDVYGGGNGSYAYTDNPKLKDTQQWGDFYYAPGSNSVEALNNFRPNAQAVSINVSGSDVDNPVIIGGALYCGGNSATLKNVGNTKAKAQLKIGSNVIAEKVFLGSNGENMVKYNEKTDAEPEGVLRIMASTDKVTTGTEAERKFNSIPLVGENNKFAEYMKGCAMNLYPDVVFDGNYNDYSSYFGSIFCGGNVGSMIASGTSTIDFNDKVVVYNKLVGGCNNAHVTATEWNADYVGGLIGSDDEQVSFTEGSNIRDRLILNLNNLKIQPLRLPISGVDDINSTVDMHHRLVWNTVKLGERDGEGKVIPVAWNDNTWKAADTGHSAEYNSTINRRFIDGNVYGGCYTSGVVNGNVVINIKATLVDRTGEHGVFDVVETNDETGEDLLYGVDYNIKEHVSGVILGVQGMDVLGTALNVFGGGKGKDTEVWGSATVNLKKGYAFQIFGGSEEGAIGKSGDDGDGDPYTFEYDLNGKHYTKTYKHNTKYSTYVNLDGDPGYPGVPKSKNVTDDMAQIEFMYGGGFLGPIAGDTHVDLGNGRVFNTFAGSCMADILGHTETYVGVNGFPYVRDYIYGGNDLGGKILGVENFTSRVRDNSILGKVHGYKAPAGEDPGNTSPDVLNASAYIEYQQGHVEKIFGGCYGVYDYTDPLYGQFFFAEGGTGTTTANKGQARDDYSKPLFGNAFVNFRPESSASTDNGVGEIYGAGQGYFGEKEENKMQESSYILVDIPDDLRQTFHDIKIFGGGECGGVGMGVAKATADATPDKASAIIDLVRGRVSAVYGGSYKEGITRRTVVNVPAGSTIDANSIFGGAYGLIDVTETPQTDEHGDPVLDDEGKPVILRTETPRNDVACDVYEANVNWASSDAIIEKGIYGGNNACRRTLYGKVNVSAVVQNPNHWTNRGIVYGAGYGVDTWSQYTEVNLNSGAEVQEAYGGGENGQVLNIESVAKWKTTKTDLYTDLEGEYTDNGLANTLASSNKLHELDNTRPEKYNCNVHINEGATVVRYCYGGGLGDGNIPYSGNVLGTTYIDLLGGTVKCDLFAAGTTGAVKDSLNVGGFVASSTAYIEGGTARNVYGGGWKGSVGHHIGEVRNVKGKDTYVTSLGSPAGDVLGETHVIIGKSDGTSFVNGIPAVERNAYGGGEGGAVFGTTHLTLNKGFIGYRYFASEPVDKSFAIIEEGGGYYQEKIDDETRTDGKLGTLYDSGCVFGGGYVDNSNVDRTEVKMLGGHVRNSIFGGGEVAAVGRGWINASGLNNSVRDLDGIYKAGKTHVELYEGFVHRNVFGGGRGYDNLGDGGRLYSDGFIFGQTEVNIYGGVVGTTEELANDNGNVFGGGDIGYVYSAFEKNGVLYRGIKSGRRYDNGDEGYYYENRNGTFSLDGTEKIPTEDCKVLIEPHTKVLQNVSINNHDYKAGDFVPIEDLNTLKDKTADKTKWDCLDPAGIVIYNAVFAGGNTSAGSAAVYANATSVFGNATASVHDVYHRDLITVGTGRTGGIYGDGNLTFVDGYRGLNITNYGTDYYHISAEITKEQYDNDLSERERAYYELRFKCVQDIEANDGTKYTAGGDDGQGGVTNASTISAEDLMALFTGVNGKDGQPILKADGTPRITDPDDPYCYWIENGVRSRYAGRLMNTIQRADFCGVFGSRMVMKGAQDRVPETVDYTNYTINRVREVSLNQIHSVISSDLTLKTGATPASKVEDQNPADFADMNNAVHGNYFGIYSIVNFLGALSSDVRFDDLRTTENSTPDYRQSITVDGQAYSYGSASYINWKRANINNRKRNNGSSLNKVALASGVYLELTSEQGIGSELEEKDWGHITGVIELDLINVQTGIGGGFVYAKNEHRKWTYNRKKHSTLTALNKDAITQRDYDYSTSESDIVEWETSGNFVHSAQTIIDDCYNVSGKYKGEDAVPAHYWYIKGQVYVYDQYVSAYTGAPNAYSETVDIPLTITAASHGTMKLLDVKPNRYAYFASQGVPLEDGKKLVINDVEYYKNDPISYWDWHLLSTTERSLFVEETYVCVTDCKVGTTSYTAGTVLLPDDYNSLRNSAPKAEIEGYTGQVPSAKQTVEGVEKTIAFDFAFRSSNNLGHDTGYILTYKVNNPREWNTWYTEANSTTHAKISTDDYHNEAGYEDGPTYHLTSSTGSLLGQRDYKVTNLISEDIYNTYQAIKNNETQSAAIPATGQAEFEKAYIVIKEATLGNTHLNVGSAVSATDAASLTGSVVEAFICTSTIQLSKTEFIYLNSKLSATEKAAYLSTVNDRISAILPAAASESIKKLGDLTEAQLNSLTAEQKKELSAQLSIRNDINNYIKPAYYCTTAGLYGGNYYEPNKNYRGLEAWCSMSENDRKKFVFNYDALDLLIDPTYNKGDDGQKYQYDGEDANGNAFTTEAQAKTNKAGYSLTQYVDYSATYNSSSALTLNTAVNVKRAGNNVSTTTIQENDELLRADFESIPNEQRHFAPIQVNEAGNYYVVKKALMIGNTPYAVGTTVSSDIYASHNNEVVKLTVNTVPADKVLYFCRESYDMGVSVSAASGVEGGTVYSSGKVPVGLVISKTNYDQLPNQQKNFTIHGIAPTETSTLYVSRNSDIFDLSTEKIITVVYEYDYEEESGGNVTPLSERHVVNIHIQFKSGIPSVEDINAPQIVLPGNIFSLREPNVIPGAYEVTGGGWELFEKISDAENHTNGIEYIPNEDQVFWYQNGYYLAYYAKTYLGKTYSNHVPVSVANYHDLKNVLEASHHYHIDKPVQRNSKIYINNYDGGKDGIDLLKDLVDLTYKNEDAITAYGTLEDPDQIQGAQNLEIILHSNISHTGGWTPIANGTGQCFSGNLHGDGYYISGLRNSLFGHLCGHVYNLGVMGSFTSAGIADAGSGYVENCWVKTTGNPTTGVKAVFNGGDEDGTQMSSDGRKLVVNCYYPETDAYTPGLATKMSDQNFYNGTVAYNLNGFYLNKRYYDNNAAWKAEATPVTYQFLKANTDGTLPEAMSSQSYPSTYALYPLEKETCEYGYVEDRYVDGDFIYANGDIPENVEERQRKIQTGTTTTTVYAPIWPDDYLYFGQMLTFDWSTLRPHEEVPSHIYKQSGRLSMTDRNNRVYRAPAYFGSKEMQVVHFNPNVNLVSNVKPKNADDTNPRPAYPGMTAIDFAGYNDGSYEQGQKTIGFYPPLLDDDGLQSITNSDETSNLLVYAPAQADNQKTFNVLTEYFTEPAYNDYYIDDAYHRVGVAPTGSVHGHLVKSGLTTTNDHLLVDKQDFNCPIRYTMGSGYRMWYQRQPDNFVTITSDNKTIGWEGICLPFEVGLVSTQDKGEITHFYGSDKTGHEYWLREFGGGQVSTENSSVFLADFTAISKGNSISKDYTNTFLWDYYYSKNSSADGNSDTYKRYYDQSHTYDSYWLQQSGVPYLVGFPGVSYYEFDLSGEFTAKNTASPAPAKLGPQTVTFASEVASERTEVEVVVSDNNMHQVSEDGYAYVPNYINKKLSTAGEAFVLATDGGSYVKNEADATVNAFRPYIIDAGASTRGTTIAPGRVERVLFSSDYPVDLLPKGDPRDGKDDGTMIIYAQKDKIVIKSTLRYTEDMGVYTPAGITLTTFPVKAGETVETSVHNEGVYIVRSNDGQFTKKLIVRGKR